MELQNHSKSVCKDRVYKYLLNKYDDGEINNDDIHNRNNNIYHNVNTVNIHRNNRNNRNNANYNLGIYQGWRTGRVIGSRWDTT